MPSELISLGQFRFSIDTAAYDELSRTTEYRWARQDRLGRNPARQYVGPGDDTISLRGTVLTTYRGGTGQVEAMRAEGSKGEPLRLVSGTGTVFGLWAILRVTETGRAFLEGGLARQVEFEIELGYYGEDGDGATQGWWPPVSPATATFWTPCARSTTGSRRERWRLFLKRIRGWRTGAHCSRPAY